MGLYQEKFRIKTNNKPLYKIIPQFQSNFTLETDFIKPHDLREDLLKIITKIENSRFLGIPAAIGGHLTLRNKGNSCFDVLPIGPMRLWYSAINKAIYGNIAAQDWIEFYTSILSFYLMRLNSRNARNGKLMILDPMPLYNELQYIKSKRIASGDSLSKRAQYTINSLSIVELEHGVWSKHTPVIARVEQWRNKRNWCRCEKRAYPILNA